MWVLIGLALTIYVFVMPALAYRKAAEAQAQLVRLQQLLQGASPAKPITASKPAPTTIAATTPAPTRRAPVPTVIVERPAPKAPSEPDGTKDHAPGLIQGWERTLGSSWSVWAGAAALAIGSIMLIKYMIDVGTLSPLVRCVLGGVFGTVLIGAGEWLTRKDGLRPIAGLPMASIPEAVTAAGVAAVYASVYAAFGFYEFLGVGATFVALAAVSLGAMALSLRHGILLAVLGTAGAFAVPALINGAQPWALGLFGYLSLVTLACQGIARHRGWIYLQALAVIAATVWVVIWIVTAKVVDQGYVVHLYVLVLLASGFLLRKADEVTTTRFNFGSITLSWSELIDLSAAVLAGVTVFAQVRMGGYGSFDVASGALVLGFMMFMARRDERLVAAAFGAVAVVAGLIVSWGISLYNFAPVPDLGFNTASVAEVLTAVVVGSAVFMIFGVVALWRVQPSSLRPGSWAMLSALAPVVLIAAAHGRGYVLAQDGPWQFLALGVAALNAAMVGMLLKRGTRETQPVVLAAYMMGMLSGVCLAVATLQNEVWLSVALALALLAIAAQLKYLNSNALHYTLAGVAIALLARLAHDPFLLSDLRSGLADLWWVVPAYGVPAACFAGAARMAKSELPARLLGLLQGGSILFSILMVSAATRLVFSQSIGAMAYMEMALHSAAWLGIAYALYLGEDSVVRPQWPVVTWARWGLAALGVSSAVLGLLLGQGPFRQGLDVGTTPLFNALFVSLFVPAIVCVLFARTARARDDRLVLILGGATGVALLFAYVNLSVRHLFHGVVFTNAVVLDAELYAYSAAWIGFAGAMIAYGMTRSMTVLRQLALGLMGITMCKVFLFDMAALTGLFRALSFLGLGGALIALGYAYQRFARSEAQDAPPGEVYEDASRS